LAAVLPVFVTERYRLAAAPGLLLFAAAGIWILWENCVRARGTMIAGYLAVVTAAGLFVTWPQRDPALWALKFYNSGLQALDLEQWPVAQKDLELAQAYAPASTEINLALGNLWHQQQNLAQAETCYLAVLRIDPRHKAALNNLGIVALSGKNWGSAGNYFRAALAVDPDDGKTHYLYARSLFEAGNIDGALSEIQIALRLRPGQREFEELYELIRGRQ
jgi:tetratricopeptide (TPR) repeat protein